MAFGDLTTAAAAIAWAQADPTTALQPGDQTTIADLVTPASDEIRAYCDRWLGPPIDWQELRDGYGWRSRSFPTVQWPIQAVLHVVIDTNVTIPPLPPIVPGIVSAAGASSQVINVSALPLQAGFRFTPTQIIVQGYQVSRLPASVLLIYTAGYPQIPTDLVQACNELILSAFVERQRAGVTSETSQGVGSQAYYLGPMPARVARMLNPYRRVAPISAFSYTPAMTSTDPATVAAI